MADEQQSDYAATMRQRLSGKAEAPPGAKPKQSSYGDSVRSRLQGKPDATEAPPTPPSDSGEKWSVGRMIMHPTESVVGKGRIYDVANSAAKGVDAFSNILPASWQASRGGQWGNQFVQSLAKEGGPELLNFATSPTGLALLAAHFVPYTAPVAYGVDMLFGVGAALQAIPDASAVLKSIAKGEAPSPEDAAHLTVDLAAAYGLKEVAKGGIRRSMPEPKPAGFSEDIISTATSMQDHPMKMAVLDAAKKAYDTKGQRRLEKLHSIPVVGDIARAAGVPLPTRMEISANIVKDRNAAYAHMTTRSLVNDYDFRRSVKPEERSIDKMGQVIEGDMTADQAGLSKEGREWVQKLKDHRRAMDEERDKLWKNDFKLADAENYLTHIWDFGDLSKDVNKNNLRDSARTLMKDRFLQKRKFATYKEAMQYFEENGIEARPRYTDVADIERARDEVAARTTANNRMAQRLRGMGVLLSEQERTKLKMNEWPQASEASALERNTYAGKTTVPERTTKAGEVKPEKDIIHEVKRPVYVHPDFKLAVETIFNSDNPGQVGKAFETLRSAEKKMRLNFSFFHHNSLTEQSHAIDITRWRNAEGKLDPAGTLKRLGQDIWLANPNYWKGIRTGMWRVAEKPHVGKIYGAVAEKVGHAVGKEFRPPSVPVNLEEFSPWIDADLQVRPSAEAESKVGNWIRDFARKSEQHSEFLKQQGGSKAAKVKAQVKTAAGKALEPLADVMDIWDTGMWDFYHQGQMLNAAENIFTDEMNRSMKTEPNMPVEKVAEMRKKVAEHVNNAFGAINYQNLLLTPQAIRAMNFGVLAPAWTLSNIRVLSSAYESEAGLRLASRWTKGAAISWFLTTQALNWAMTSYYQMPDKNGKKGGHWSWENPGAQMKGTRMGENDFNVAAGYNYDDKGEQTSEKYLRMGKAFREPFMWMLDPLSILSSKIGQLPRQLVTILSGHGPGGYEEVNLSDQTYGHTMPPDHAVLQIVSMLGSQGIPMVLDDIKKRAVYYLFPDAFPKVGPDQTKLGLPTVQGITFSRAVSAYKSAKNNNDDKAADAVLDTVEANHLDAGKIVAAARREITTEQKKKNQREEE